MNPTKTHTNCATRLTPPGSSAQSDGQQCSAGSMKLTRWVPLKFRRGRRAKGSSEYSTDSKKRESIPQLLTSGLLISNCIRHNQAVCPLALPRDRRRLLIAASGDGPVGSQDYRHVPFCWAQAHHSKLPCWNATEFQPLQWGAELLPLQPAVHQKGLLQHPVLRGKAWAEVWGMERECARGEAWTPHSGEISLPIGNMRWTHQLLWSEIHWTEGSFLGDTSQVLRLCSGS